jgi:signal transduction histidine kinase
VAFIVPTAVIVIYRELSRRQQKQGDLERRLAAERTLGKAKDDFVANASHELRTPLTSIYGLALLLEEDPAFDQSETAPELLDMIISETSDLSRMVEDLLTTARLDAGALHYTFENVAVLEEIDEVVGPMSRAGAEITVDCEPGIVRCDRLRLRQVLRNLLSNARKYGGPELRVEGHAEEGKFVFAVVDDGDGIPPEIRDRLFQRYIHKGTQPMILGSVGLGLSIVKALTEGMGGSIHYERRDGHTRFVFAMPLVAVMQPTVVTEAAGNPEFPDVESEGYGVGAPSVEEVGFRGGGSREP